LIARHFLGGRAAPWTFRTRSGRSAIYDPSASAVLTLSEPEALVQAARQGAGIAQVAVHLFWPDPVAYRLKVLLSDQHHPGDWEMAIQYPHRALLAPRL
jgi:DNA-binding transcriptional LysR family regulator